VKITKINQNRSFIVNLKFLKTKNYFLHNLTFKNIQSKFVKGLKVISKYNAYNKKIIFFNNCPSISIALKQLIKKTRHIYVPNFVPLLNNFDLKKSLIYKSGLLVLLNVQTNKSKKTNSQIKIPSLWVGSNLKYCIFKTTYKIIANFLLKKHKYLFFFIFLRSAIKKS
jgi:hypothetical protein